VAALAPPAGRLIRVAGVRRLVVAVAVVALTAIVPGCASDGDGDGDGEGGAVGTTAPPPVGVGGEAVAASRPACDMLTREEVVAALGNPVRDPVPVGDRGCTWATDVDGGTSLDISAVKASKDRTAFECRALRRGQPGEATREPVSGLADGAVWVWEKLADPIVQGSVVSCWDDSAVSVLLTGEKDQAALRATAVDMAKKIHSRL
jgi:hypothetical protein